MPGYSLYFRLSRQTPHDSPKVMAAVKRIVKTYCFTRSPAPAGPARAGRPRTPRRLLAVDRAVAQHADDGIGSADEARRIDDGRRDARVGRPGVEVHRDAVAQHPLARRPRRSPATCPVRFALETASGPVSSSSSRAIRCAGMRTATVPWVSPRSHVSDGCDGSTIVSPPGQNSSTSRSTGSGTSATSARSVVRPATSTGGGDCRPRPFASRSRATARGSNASAAMPYTVSVGRTTSSPLPMAWRAWRMPARSCASSRQSKIGDMSRIQSTCGVMAAAAWLTGPAPSWPCRASSDRGASRPPASRRRTGSRGSPRPATRRAR